MFTQVASLSQVKAYTYFIDKAASRIYIYRTVKPQNVEVSARMFSAVNVNWKGIKFNNIDFRNTCHTGLYFFASGSQVIGNSLVTNCNFTQNRNVGIMFDNGYSNSRVGNCTSTFNGNGFYSWSDLSYGSDSNTFNHCYSGNNIFYQVGVITDGHGFGIYNSTNNIVEYCESSGDKYGINIDPAGRANSIIIRYNYVHDGQSNTPGISVGGDVPAGTVHHVYYNLVVNTGLGDEGYAIWVHGLNRLGTVYLVNNTIYNDALHSQYGIFSTTGNNLVMRNNIIFCNAFNAVLAGMLSGSGTVDNNLYYAPNAASKMFYFADYVNSFAQWKAVTHQDNNSIYGNPLLNTDYTLQTGSPAINKGYDFGLKTDMKGNIINGFPDLGCYEKL
jgi:Right handed beta helix region